MFNVYMFIPSSLCVLAALALKTARQELHLPELQLAGSVFLIVLLFTLFGCMAGHFWNISGRLRRLCTRVSRFNEKQMEVGELKETLDVLEDTLKERFVEIGAMRELAKSRNPQIGERGRENLKLQGQIRFIKRHVQESIASKKAARTELKNCKSEHRKMKDGDDFIIVPNYTAAPCPLRKTNAEDSVLPILQMNPQELSLELHDKALEGQYMLPSSQKTSNFYEDYESFYDSYELGSWIGQGTYGQVFAATRKSDHLRPDDPEPIPMEVATMRAVCAFPSCPWVIQLLDWYCISTELMLVLELPEHSVSLFDFAQNNRTTLTEKRASLIFHQIVKAVQHCHGRGVSHNDLKLDNVLIELPTEQVKIIDFGNALFLEPEEGSHHVGMGFYAPPGCFLQNRSRTFPLTVKTLGTLLYEMLCQSTYFEREFKINHNIFNCKRQLSMECRELIHWCLKPQPSDRPTLEEILVHPFVSLGLH
ncbi:serine/threonine-protein kinase pim-2-like isoform X2 [Polypterus senegalus]|uniref:serine/threonine-protein kinase pim-2-like isoform X2 n=1 Tax=Polypterus senegalus TaxID=55291 RepID=UPI001963DBFE|nr:serine/threonine-protein kinase pim-2-like isoform X2 [Polypterus senegalus]